jgi:hypothetical protein
VHLRRPAEEPQQLLGEEPVEALVAQEAVEPRQGRAELHVREAGELTDDGETAGLRGLAEGGDQRGAGLLL